MKVFNIVGRLLSNRWGGRREAIWYFWEKPIIALDFVSARPKLFHSLIQFDYHQPEVLLNRMYVGESV